MTKKEVASFLVTIIIMCLIPFVNASNDQALLSTESPTPNITMSILTNYTGEMFTVDISGYLKNGNVGISGAPIIISVLPSSMSGSSLVSVFGIDSGSSVTTNDDGSYTFGISTLSAGSFEIMTAFRGNDLYSSTELATYLSIKRVGPEGQGGIFAVSASSPVSDLSYDFSSRELSFQLAQTDKPEQVKAQISKALIKDSSNVQTLLDGTPITNELESNQDNWVFSFAQTKNNSTAVIALGTQPTAPTASPIVFDFSGLRISDVITWIIGPIIFVVISLLFIFKRRKSQTNPKKE